MTYDPASQRIVLFGGTSRNQQFYPTSVRTWDGTTWQPPS